MLEIFFGVLLAVATRDAYLELLSRYRQYKFNKDWETVKQLAEDFEADDEDIK